MITRLRSEKGSFVRSPLGAFDSEESAVVLDRTATLEQSLNGQGWGAPESAPTCSIGANFGGGSGAAIFFSLKISTSGEPLRAPTIAEYITHFAGTTWVSQIGGEFFTFDSGSVFCSGTDTVDYSVYIPGTERDRFQIRESEIQTYLGAILVGDSPVGNSGPVFDFVSEAP